MNPNFLFSPDPEYAMQWLTPLSVARPLVKKYQHQLPAPLPKLENIAGDTPTNLDDTPPQPLDRSLL